MAILDSFRLDGKVALATGSARGLGRGMALALAEAGADVALLDREPCGETADEVLSAGRRCYTIEADLGKLSAIGAAGIMERCATSLGEPDVLVSNAGIIRRGAAENLSEEDWSEVIATNLTAGFLLAQAFAKRRMALGAGGKIVFTASMLSFQGGLNAASYAASKSGVAGLVRALCNEWAPRGIQVNAIAPGYFESSVTEVIRNDPGRERSVRDRIPAGRWGVPRDLAGAVVFLASPASDYVNGAILPVDGGWLAR